MKSPLGVLVCLLAVTALACNTGVNLSIPRVTTGPTETFTVNVPRPGNDVVAVVTLRMAAGSLNLSGGAEGLMQGTVRYNVPAWQPKLLDDNGAYTLAQGRSEGFNGLPGNDIVNEWDLKLGDVLMNLAVDAGAYKGDLDLSGVRLNSLNITDGASRAQVHFDRPNPAQMADFTYTTGASSLQLNGLGNANFTRMTFKGGGGSFTLDFAGLQRDAQVTVDVAASQLTVIIPAGTRAHVLLSGGLTNVDAQGTWTHTASSYDTGSTGPLVTIDAKMGIGNLKLIAK